MFSSVRSHLTSTRITQNIRLSRYASTKRRTRQRSPQMKVAIEGCCHGELDQIYSEIQNMERKNNTKVDLLLVCGDFEAIRNYRDLQCMAVPDKYKKLQTFHKYYTGEKRAPVLTIIIGGNHEASNYFWELYHGGWVARNIYYLGHAGCVNVNGLRIAGASGIFKEYSFSTGNYETIPYTPSTLRSVYHIREYCVRRLSLLSGTDIFLSHDWPQHIVQHGNVQSLLKAKPFWRDEIAQGTLGSPPLMGLLHTLKPAWWFAAHMHVKFTATVEHPPEPILYVDNPDEITIEDDEVMPSAPPTRNNPDEIMLDDEETDVVAPPPAPPQQPPNRETKFVALDKCLPKRKFLEYIDIDAPQPMLPGEEPTLTFDLEWLAICRAFAPWFSTAKFQRAFPDEGNARKMVAKELEWVKENVGENKEVSSYQQFVRTAPGPGTEGKEKDKQPPMYPNAQTRAFCKMLGIEDKINPPESGASRPASS
ncbi:lariat debranching enzyme, C-terminal domain-containing protein [Mucidula mucida]|nr:lariat debranching enzyme, C-terminal domain-containing protein [Mucidula mucida]